MPVPNTRKIKKRLDLLLVERGLTENRDKALKLILSGRVLVFNPETLAPYPPSQIKPGNLFPEQVNIQIKSLPKYVSRGGDKLESALQFWQFPVREKICLDIGSSTGGFTDCLLQNGAKMVYAVDVGTGQLDPKIRNDSRVRVFERTHILKWRACWEEDRAPSLITADLSFISLAGVLKKIREIQKNQKYSALLLIKPQFEAGKKFIKKGIVKDEEIRGLTIQKILNKSIELGFKNHGHFPCPVLGAKGNQEEWLHLEI